MRSTGKRLFSKNGQFTTQKVYRAPLRPREFPPLVESPRPAPTLRIHPTHSERERAIERRNRTSEVAQTAAALIAIIIALYGIWSITRGGAP